ncbi:MAG: STAS domain-containing protein [Hyphomicrobiales bacterium]|nr:MAG: STAS domain-containing protein [Hyphomicrobiales bacterium]
MAESSDARIVALPAIVDLDALDNVRDRLIDAVELGGARIDASQVERVATNALFMLISAAETAKRNSFPFEIVGASAPMNAAIERLGLDGAFAGLMKG